MGLVSAVGGGGHGVFGGGGQTAMSRALACGRPDQAAERHEIGAPLCGVGSGSLPAGRTVDVAGLRWPDGEHGFGVGAEPELCRCCWEAAHCPRQFAYPPAQHETLLGRLPLASRLAQRVLQQVRPWIEPAQSFEKNQLGLGDVFFNSLRFTWTMALLADAAVLLRARALLGRPPLRPLLAPLMPFQLSLELGPEIPMPFLPKPNTNSQNPQ